MPGPNHIYSCPGCGNLLYTGSLASGNTFGAKLYSDGKQLAPMLPDFPSITKCKKCNTIFWLNEETLMGTEDIGPERPNADYADFLSVYDCVTAINSDLCKSNDDEKYFRYQIMFGFNDRVRNGNPKFINEGDELLWEENISTFMDLLDPKIMDERILLAELYRYLGDFSKCIEIIDSIDEPQLEFVKEKLMAECEKGNKELIVLFE